MKKLLFLILLFVPSLAFGQTWSNVNMITGNFAGGGTDVTNYLTIQLASNSNGHKTWTLPNSNGTANYFLQTDGSGNLTWAAGAAGTVTSVALTMPGIFSVSGSPITSSGTFTVTLATESANTILAGPTTGSAAAPTFRALVAADLPAGTGTVTSVGLTAPSILTVSGSPVTTSGTLALTLASESQNFVFAGPTSGSGAPTFRALTAGDMPGGGFVSSVTNSDGTLTISPTTGAVVASLALSHANSWTGAQTFGMHNYTETTPTALAANTNNYAIETTNSMVYLTASSAVNLTGIAAGTDGQTYFLINNGTHAITLTDQDASSSSGNRFLFFSGNKILEPNGIIMIIYDGTSVTKGWRCITPN